MTPQEAAEHWRALAAKLRSEKVALLDKNEVLEQQCARLDAECDRLRNALQELCASVGHEWTHREAGDGVWFQADATDHCEICGITREVDP